MEAKEFIQKKIKELVEKVPTINVSYEFINDIDTHILEVIPLEQFEDNEKFVGLENELYDAFTELYFPSTLLLVSEDSINRVENPEWIIKGAEYGVLTQWGHTLQIEGFNIEPDYLETVHVGVDYMCCEDILCCEGNSETNYALAA